MSQAEDPVPLPADAERGGDHAAGAAKPRPRGRPASETRPGGARRDPPPLPDVTRDELDDSWGERADDRDEWYLRERPPHHE